jgi:hypothetical protein
MAELLHQNGLAVEVAAVNRVDWLRNAAGVTDLNYWKGTLNPRPTVDWYVCAKAGISANTAQLS